MSVSPALPDAPEKPARKRSVFAYLWALGRRRRSARPSTAGGMTVLQHLEELRVRAMKAGIALVVMTAISFLFSNQLLDVLTLPIGGRGALESIEITENVSVYMRVTLLAGIALAFPLVLHQVVAYVAPGLTPRERRWLFALVPCATLLFIGGVAFAWFVMIPAAMPFLINFLEIPTRPRPLNYISFVNSLLLWVGLSFEMPLVIFFFAKLKWVTAGQLLRGWRYAFMGIATLAALVTPTVDPVNMLLVMLPLFGLYLLSILLAKFA
jgi:sec-independent protein translocase protein TatC